MVLKVAKENNTSINDYNQEFSLNGRSEKFNYFALNSTESTGISEAKSANKILYLSKMLF
jgi:vitamin B12 transporter